MLKKHLHAGGRIVIAIENRMGLKYLAGCREDHLGTYFSGIEGYNSESVARTFTPETVLYRSSKDAVSIITISIIHILIISS